MIVAEVASQANIAAHPCRADTRRERRQNRFLRCFAACLQVSLAADRARIHRDSHYDWLNTDPTYAERFAETEKRAARTLEDEAVRRAHQGVRRPVLYQGAQVIIDGEPLFQIEYSDRLLMFLLKANNPEKFKDQPLVTIDLRDFDGDFSKLSPKVLDGVIDELTKRIAAKKAREGLLEASADSSAANATVDVQTGPVTIDVKEMGRQAVPREASEARLQHTLQWMR